MEYISVKKGFLHNIKGCMSSSQITVCENNNYILPPKRKKRKVRCAWLSCYSSWMCIVTVVLLCYWNSSTGDLVHDDIVAITNNPDVHKGALWGQLWSHDFWGRPIGEEISHKSYRPLTVITFKLNYLIGQLEPTGYHVINIILHITVCYLFCITCEQVLWGQRAFQLLPSSTYTIKMSTLAALLFATHPVHTESVSGIVGRGDLLACVLFLGSFLLYTRGVESRNKLNTKCNLLHITWPIGGSLLLAVLAMLAKETGITVLGVSLIYDIFILSQGTYICVVKEPREWRKILKPVLRRISIIISVIMCMGMLRSQLIGFPHFKPEDNPTSHDPNLLTRLLTYGYIYWLNFSLLLCPWKLNYDWSMGSVPLIHNLLEERNIFTLLFFLVLATTTYRGLFSVRGEVKRGLFLGLILLVIPFLPAANILFPVGFVIAERVLYIPSLGYVILVVQCISVAYHRTQKHRAKILIGSLLLASVWAGRTVMRNKVWTSRYNLFRSGVETLPHNAKMHYNYANLMKDLNESHIATYHYQQAIKLWPNYASAYNNLGTITGNGKKAEKLYQQAITVTSGGHPSALFNLASELIKAGNTRGAISVLHTCIQSDPLFSEAHTQLGILFADQGANRKAEKHYQKAISIHPNNPNFHNNLAVFLAGQGRVEEALDNYRKAYELNGNNFVSVVNAAKLLISKKRFSEAQNVLRQAILSDTVVTVSDLLMEDLRTGNSTQAGNLFRKILLAHSNKEIVLLYVQVLMETNDLQGVELILTPLANQESPNIQALQYLANIYGLTDRHMKAVLLLEKALSLTTDSKTRAQIHFEIGNHLKDSGQIIDAVGHYEKTVSLNLKHGEAHFNLAVYYHLSGHLVAAERHYTSAQILLPSSELLQQNIHKFRQLQKQLELHGNCKRICN